MAFLKNIYKFFNYANIYQSSVGGNCHQGFISNINSLDLGRSSLNIAYRAGDSRPAPTALPRERWSAGFETDNFGKPRQA